MMIPAPSIPTSLDEIVRDCARSMTFHNWADAIDYCQFTAEFAGLPVPYANDICRALDRLEIDRKKFCSQSEGCIGTTRNFIRTTVDQWFVVEKRQPLVSVDCLTVALNEHRAKLFGPNVSHLSPGYVREFLQAYGNNCPPLRVTPTCHHRKRPRCNMRCPRQSTGPMGFSIN